MPDGTLRVSVVFSPAPRDVREWALDLPAGSTVADAIAASPLRTEFPGMSADAMAVGVWGRKATPAQALRDLDRIELYRPLKVDPKVARRERFQRQGARAAGLFARKRRG
jgi:hypothetical protein